MTGADREMWEPIVQKQREQTIVNSPRSPVEPPPTIHYTDLPEDTSGGPIAKEWNFYRRVVGRLLEEGKEGKWILINGEEIVGIWDTEEEARSYAVKNYPKEPLYIRHILKQEPVLRTPTFLYRWQH
jgi:hypothetical protein